MLFIRFGKGLLYNMELRKPKEYQTVRLFAVLGVLTLITALLLKMVLLAPQKIELDRVPAQSADIQKESPDFIAQPGAILIPSAKLKK